MIIYRSFINVFYTNDMWATGFVVQKGSFTKSMESVKYLFFNHKLNRTSRFQPIKKSDYTDLSRFAEPMSSQDHVECIFSDHRALHVDKTVGCLF